MVDRFPLVALCVVSIVWITGSLPVFSSAIADLTGTDVLFVVGNGSGIGSGKIKFAVCLVAGAMGLLTLAAIALPGRVDWRRVAILLCTGVVLAPLPLWLDRARDDDDWASLQHVEIVFRPDVRGDWFLKETLPRHALSTFDGLYMESSRRYEQAREHLQTSWLAAGQTLHAMFLMNLAAGMYEFGAPPSTSTPDCIDLGGEDGVAIGEAQILNSQIGCCDDFARVLAVLLDRAGIANRLVRIPGHVFNEARLDMRWRAMDPSINVLYDRSWREIVTADRQTKIKADWFPLRSASDASAPSYRSVLPQFRIHMTLVAGKRNGQYQITDTIRGLLRQRSESGLGP